MNSLKSTVKKALINTKNNLEYNYLSLFPTKVDIMSPAFIQKPHQILHKLRKVSPIHYLPKQKAWLAINYDDVVTILTQHESFSSSPFEHIDNGVFIGADPPEHTRVRDLLKEHFSYQQVIHFKRTIEYHTKCFSEKIKQLKQFDLLKDLAQPLTNTIIADFLGIDPNKTVEVRDNKQVYYSLPTIKPFLTNGGFLQNLCQDERFSEQETLDIIRFLLEAGLGTTQQALCNMLYITLLHPQVMDEVRNKSELIPRLIEESLRIEPIIIALPRLTLKDVQFGSVMIPSGSLVYASMVGANRDPQKFEQPDKLILHRHSPKPLTFGLGIHQCLGKHIANLQLQIIVETLLTDFPTLRSVYPLSQVELGTDILSRGVKNFKLTF